MGVPMDVVKLLLAHPGLVVTKAALMAADEGDHEDIVRLMFVKQPQVILDLFESATPCKSGGSLESEVHQREKASALALLLAVERHAGVLRFPTCCVKWSWSMRALTLLKT
jgi:hypothetical protein